MKHKKLLLLSLLCMISGMSMALTYPEFSLKSPDGQLNATIEIGKTISYSILHDGDRMLEKSALAMMLAGGGHYGVNAHLKSSSRRAVNDTINAVIYKRKKVADHYNELTLNFTGYKVIFRVYNDGLAYRFVSLSKKPFLVENELAEFNFPDDAKAYVAYVKEKGKSLDDQFFNSFENTYQHLPISAWDKNRLAFSPLAVEGLHGKKICIAEADLFDYPGMFLYQSDKLNGLKGMFSSRPKAVEQGGYNQLQGMVTQRESYIASYEKGTEFPWRIIVVAKNDYQLADNDMVYKLARPAVAGADFSWIKPGKVAWDWWNDWNISQVDFRSGINNDTYKYYIDFAASQGIEYVILDEGWSVNKKADLFQVIPEIDLKELVKYGKERHVGLILWAGYYAFERDLEAVCKQYSELGIKGFKIDFMDRDDQLMVSFIHRAAQVAAKHKLLLDLHGTYKPTGLQRSYPNVINFEGVNGQEQMKWSPVEHDQVTYDVTIPFIRQLAGPLDYTQGAMRNAIRSNFRPVNSEPMSQGTRCRQLAAYVVFEAPLTMLCDNPTNYMREETCTRFIAGIPTVWDQTIALNGEISKYVTIARQSGKVWYVGSMTNWEPRTIPIDFSFLGAGSFHAELIRDGINADKAASDYKSETFEITAGSKLNVLMAPGGGFVLKITKT